MRTAVKVTVNGGVQTEKPQPGMITPGLISIETGFTSFIEHTQVPNQRFQARTITCGADDCLWINRAAINEMVSPWTDE